MLLSKYRYMYMALYASDIHVHGIVSCNQYGTTPLSKLRILVHDNAIMSVMYTYRYRLNLKVLTKLTPFFWLTFPELCEPI